ncbi:hypothetical protein [Desulfothermobacter acidiphilus]|uniref:hypothetical protein n=1 Tax=Desulfothermobacter acidiphilus TaxID=1938353 RepID=UPI003F8C2213
MIAELVTELRVKPANLESALLELDALRVELAKLQEERSLKELEILREVANELDENGKRRFPNEELRKTEAARRGKESQEIQALDGALAELKAKISVLEARIERLKWELRSASGLLNLLAAGAQAGNQQVLEAFGLRALAPEAETQDQRGEEVAATRGSAESDLEEGVFEVLETRRSDKGVLRAWTEDEKGRKVAVFAKGGAAEALERAAGKKVKIRFRRLDKGLFAVKLA